MRKDFMTDYKHDFEQFAKILKQVEPNDTILGDKIVVAMVHLLNNPTLDSKYIAVDFPLNINPLLTIQQFLSRYGFHIEYSHNGANGIVQYSIKPNWK